MTAHRQISSPVLPPRRPLAAPGFTAALVTGHGRVLQHLADHGADGLDDAIIHACLFSVSYDPQCEAPRAPWLVSIVERAQLTSQLLQAIDAMLLSSSPENHRDMEQRSAILSELAQAGVPEARRLLYGSLVRLTGTAGVIGAEHIIALGGEDGLIHVARQLGQWVRADPTFRVDDYLVTTFDESAGTGRGFALLERRATVDADVAAYLDAVRQNVQQRSSHSVFDATAYSGAQIVAHVENNLHDPCHWLRRWRASATSEECEIVFQALLESDQPDRVKRLFGCFGKTGVPRFDARLLAWIDHEDEQVQWAAIKALAPITHPRLRQAALRLITHGTMEHGISLLVNNFEADDFSFCTSRLPHLDDADERHRLLTDLLDLCKAHPGAMALECLLKVYEYSPCSTCRRDAVEAMTNSCTAPGWVLAEAALDADPRTRALAMKER